MFFSLSGWLFVTAGVADTAGGSAYHSEQKCRSVCHIQGGTMTETAHDLPGKVGFQIGYYVLVAAPDRAPDWLDPSRSPSQAEET